MNDGIEILESVDLRAEDDSVFRAAQLLLILAAVDSDRIQVDRLTYYDYFAANPFVIFSEGSPERSQLMLAGFATEALSYMSSAQRFATRQERVSADLALLVAYGLAAGEFSDSKLSYAITQRGTELVARLVSMYADGYRKSAALILKRLRSMSDTRLNQLARSWLETDDLDVDIRSALTTAEALTDEASR